MLASFIMINQRVVQTETRLLGWNELVCFQLRGPMGDGRPSLRNDNGPHSVCRRWGESLHPLPTPSGKPTLENATLISLSGCSVILVFVLFPSILSIIRSVLSFYTANFAPSMKTWRILELSKCCSEYQMCHNFVRKIENAAKFRNVSNRRKF